VTGARSLLKRGAAKPRPIAAESAVRTIGARRIDRAGIVGVSGSIQTLTQQGTPTRKLCTYGSRSIAAVEPGHSKGIP
jgi:hypothetical protein